MFQYVIIALLAIVGVILAVNVVKGLIRGLKKTVGSLIAIVLSAIISLVVTLLVCKPSSGIVANGLEIIKNMLPSGTIQELFTIEELGEALSYYAVMLVAPFFFTLAFCVISIIISIVVAILVKIIPPFKKPGALVNRLGGALVGLVCGILVAIILIMPIVGTVDLVSSIDSLTAADEEAAESDEVTDLIHSAAENKTVDLFLNLGCAPMYNYFSSAKYEGERVYLKNEVSALLEIVDNIDVFAGELSTYGDSEIEALRSIVASLETSPLLENTVAGIFSTAAEKWTAGETFIGIEKPESGEMLDPIIDTMLEVLTSSDKDNIGKDLETMTEVFAIMVKHQMFTNGNDFEAMLTKLGESSAISELIVVINENERMSPLADEVVDLSIRVLASTIGIPENAQERYDLLMTNVADIVSSTYGMSDEERASYIEGDLADAFEKYGVEVDGEAIENVAISIVTDLGDDPDVSAEDVEEFFAVYAIASAESTKSAYSGYDLLSSGDVPEFTVNGDGTISINGKVLENYNAENYRSSSAYGMGAAGADFGKASTLYSADAMESTLITVDDICSTLGKYSDCENIAEEAQKISDIITKSLETFNGIDFDSVTTSELMPKIGEVLDLMNESDIFGQEMSSAMLTAMLQSEQVTESLGISAKECTAFANKINEMVENGHFDYTHATEIITDTITMIESSNGSEKTKEEKREETSKLLDNMTKESAEMLSTMVTPSMVENYGVASANSEAVSSAVGSLLDNMASYESKDDNGEAAAKEADAVSTILDLAMTGSTSTGALFNGEEGEGNLKTTADEFVDLIVTSEVVSTTVDQLVYADGYNDNPLGISELGEQDRSQITNAIEEYYVNNGGGEELARQLEAIATILNVDVELD